MPFFPKHWIHNNRISGHWGSHSWVRNISDSLHITANRKPLTPSLHGICSVPIGPKKVHTMVKKQGFFFFKKITFFYVRGIPHFTAFSFLEEHMYLHHQKEAQNRCHWNRIYSADSELIPCWRICSRCCAACAGPSRQSRGRRNCTRPSCTAGRRRAVPRVEVKSLNQSRLSSGTSYRIVFLVCSCYLNSLRKVCINTISLYVLPG